LIFGCRTLAVFKGAGLLILASLFLLAECDRSFHRARRVPRWTKTRTLHKSGEGCGTRIGEAHSKLGLLAQILASVSQVLRISRRKASPLAICTGANIQPEISSDSFHDVNDQANNY
jgi:hypothetical protein